jgi:low affinity Fe/Cu permease
MQNYRVVPAVPAAVLAQRVLDVCITNDDTAIDIELKQVLCQTGNSATGIESEKQELIRAIAMSMNQRRKACNEVVKEPRFGVWIDLLRHLSAGEPASVSAAPARES